MRSRVISVLTLLVVAGATATLQSFAAEPVKLQETAFHVELVIFRPLTPLGVREDWALEASGGHASPGTAVDDDTGGDSTPSGPGRLAVGSLSPALFRLSGIESDLQTQPRLRSDRPHRLDADRRTPWLGSGGESVGGGLEWFASAGHRCAGTRQVPHLRLNLGYTPGDAPASLMGDVQVTGPVTFSLTQVRRVRPFERHYFDHPAYGVIAMITPVS